jgi:hypothetical protein
VDKFLGGQFLEKGNWGVGGIVRIDNEEITSANGDWFVLVHIGVLLIAVWAG